MEESKQVDCVTVLKTGKDTLIVNGFLNRNSKQTAADKLVHVIKTETLSKLST